MSKAPIAHTIRQNTDCTVIEARRAAAAVFEELARVLQQQGVLQIHGFGTFKVLHREARRAVNPKTRAEVTLPRRRGVRFKPSQKLCDQL